MIFGSGSGFNTKNVGNDFSRMLSEHMPGVGTNLPLNDESVYARFLAKKGEGVHHLTVATPSFGDTVAEQAKGEIAWCSVKAACSTLPVLIGEENSTSK